MAKSFINPARSFKVNASFLESSGAVDAYPVRELWLFPEVWTELTVSEENPAAGMVRITRGVSGPMAWLANIIYCRTPVQFSAARIPSLVNTTTSPNQVKLAIYSNLSMDASTDTPIVVSNDKPFRLPRLAPSRYWRFDILNASKSEMIQELVVATSMDRLR